MNSKLKIGLIAVIGVALIALVLVLLQSPGQNAPATSTPTKSSVSSNAAVSPVSATPTAPAVTTRATPQPTSAATAAPAATPTMTAEEQKVMDAVLKSSPQFTVASSDCGKILQSEPWCGVVQDTRQITRPEWEELFPQTKFFLVKRDVVGRESGFQQNLLIAEQAGQQYSADSFQRLLDANGIVITDTNRELVAKALVLMKLTDYLQENIVFSDWGTTDQPAPFDLRYNYQLTAWTKVQGLKFEWVFFFHEGSLITAKAGIREQHVGDYIDVPFDLLPLPSSSEALQYWRK